MGIEYRCDRCHDLIESDDYEIRKIVIVDTFELNTINEHDIKSSPYFFCEGCREYLDTVIEHFIDGTEHKIQAVTPEIADGVNPDIYGDAAAKEWDGDEQG